MAQAKYPTINFKFKGNIMLVKDNQGSEVKILLNGTYVPISEALKNKDTNGLNEIINDPNLVRTTYPHPGLKESLPGFESVKNINKDNKCQ